MLPCFGKAAACRALCQSVGARSWSSLVSSSRLDHLPEHAARPGQARSKQRTSSPLSGRRRPDPSSSSSYTDIIMVPEDLSFQFIREITDDFSEKRKLGEGAFGVVYKGVTKNGQDVAVKKLKPCADLDNEKFRNEFHTLVKLNHQNIVKILGYCYETEKKTFMMPDGRKVFVDEIHTALCFEYMHNGSLQKHLSDESREVKLDWHMRFKIIKGICEGLKYMHKDLEEPIYHFDLKPDNILLDKDMVPKVADFGLSKIFVQETAQTTRNPYGTRGYQPPEYIHKGEISGKFDIFSLGVVMLRIVTGSMDYPESSDSMSSYEYIDEVRDIWRNKLQETCSSSDSLLQAYSHQVETCTKIALKCLDKESHKRPDIVKITEELNEIEIRVDKLPEKGCGIIVSKMTAEQNNNIEIRKESKDITCQHQNTVLLPSSSCTKLELIDADVVEEFIVGRKEEKGEVITSLLESSLERISILPIHGIGGIGKTTFSRLIYNDPKFKCYSKAWVHVSHRFDLNKICESIISQLSEKENQTNERHAEHSYLTKLLAKLLAGKNIMIVLDDLWEDNQFWLKELKDMLYHDDSKIIVLVTTRSECVAERICTNILPHKILPLTNDMCWDIIKQRSDFGARDDKEQLMDIGQEIAQKCAGVALAAQSLGFTLRGMDFDQWKKVKDNGIWKENVSKDISLPNHVLASLMLSYSYMDLCLQQCFTYCAIFPKGHEIVKNDLIYQWISLDFIKPMGLLSVMDLCKKYIMQLQGLSFLQESPKVTLRSSGAPVKLKMHDLVHDLAKLVCETELVIFNEENRLRTCDSPCYAIVFACEENFYKNNQLAGLKALHIKDCPTLKFEWYNSSFAECLQVLDISGLHIEKLPSSIGNLMQLRYLYASGIHCKELPKAIGTLSKLQYLNLHGSSISGLPDSVTKLDQLMHLDISDCKNLQALPSSFCQLKCLCFLSLKNCYQLCSLPDDLAGLQNLESLNLSGCSCLCKLPESLGVLKKLKQLDLSDCQKLTKLPDSFVRLAGLQYLNTSSCSELNVPVDGLNKLVGLKYVDMSSCPKLVALPEEFCDLEHLHTLNLSGCSQLGNLPEKLGQMKSIRFILLDGCAESVRKPILQHRLGAGLQSLPAFVIEVQVGSIRSNITQLEQEKFSELELYRLENVREVYEAKALKMTARSGLSSLGLKWTLDASRFVEDEALLQALEPPEDLQKLRVQGYMGEMFPKWNVEIGSFRRVQLDELGLMHFPMCNSLPQLGQLANLKKLHLCQMPNIRRLGRELGDDTGALRNLQSFTLEKMENLEEWCTTLSMASASSQHQHKPEGLFMFPSLQELNIHHCPQLTMIPCPPRSIYWEVRASRRALQQLLGKDEAMQSLAEYMGLQCPFGYTTELHVNGSSSSFPHLPSDGWKFNASLITLRDLGTSDCCGLIDTLLAKGNGMQCLVNLDISGIEVKDTRSLLEQVETVVYSPRSSLAKSRPDLFLQQPIINSGASPHFLVSGFASCALDGWIDKVTSFLGNLIRINMEDLPMCNRLPPLGQLPGLQELRFKGMPKITRIDDRDFCGRSDHSSSSVLCFPRLTKFVLNDMPNLEEWVTTVSGSTSTGRYGRDREEFMFMFPKLAKLTIWNCPQLKLKPGLPRAEEWDINNSDPVIASSYDRNRNSEGGEFVTMLQVLSCKVPPSNWKLLHHLPRIQNLAIVSCHGMEALPESIQSLSSLQSLTVSKCHGLKHLPEWLGDLTSLHSLMVVSCPLEFLPGGMRRLSFLRSLTLSCCDRLAALPGWMGDLNSLVKITIEGCKSLKSLPQLYSLQHLLIGWNDELDRWCESGLNKAKFAGIKRQGFWLEIHGQSNSYILPARSLDIVWRHDGKYWKMHSHPQSRYAASMELLEVWWLKIKGCVPQGALPANTSYDVYLVYKLADEHDGLRWGESRVLVDGVQTFDAIISFVDQDAVRFDRVAYPVTRSEGWMELRLGEFSLPGDSSAVEVRVFETTNTYAKKGLIVEGMEIRAKSMPIT